MKKQENFVNLIKIKAFNSLKNKCEILIFFTNLEPAPIAVIAHEFFDALPANIF